MNIRNIHGISSQKELYELATIGHGLHVGSVDKLIAFVIDIQQRAIASSAALDGGRGEETETSHGND